MSAQASRYLPQKVAGWTEADWNWHIREALTQQGFRTFHIREASETGVSDLVVYRMQYQQSIQEPNYQVIDCWMELKVEYCKSGSNIRPAQRQFMKEHWKMGQNALFVAFDKSIGSLVVVQGDLKGRQHTLPCDPYLTEWARVFGLFKCRK